MTSRSGWWRALRASLLIATLAAALSHAIGLTPLRFLTQIDLAIADAQLRAFMPGTLDPRIVIVDVDEKSLAEVGRWPWSRDRVAALVDELFVAQKASVVGFDMLFAEPDTSSGLALLKQLAARSPQLAAQLAQHADEFNAELDYDARFARSLVGRNAVLGFYLTNERDARKAGSLPAPVFGAEALKGLPVSVTRWDGYAANIDTLAKAAPSAGFFNNVPDPDGLVRAVPLVAEFDHGYYETLALAMYRKYTGNPRLLPGLAPRGWMSGGKDVLGSVMLVQSDKGGLHTQAIPVDALGQVRVPFRGPGGPRGGSYQYVSASDLLSHRIATESLAGKLVLVGTSAPGVYDQRSTPVGDVYPGVEVHASLLSGLLDDRLPVVADWAAGVQVLELLFTFGLLAWWLPRLRPIRAAQWMIVLFVVLLAIELWSYRVHGVMLPIASVLVLSGVVYFGTTVWGYIVEGRSRRSLERLFGSYVPPELVTEMARDPARYDMRAENKVLTIMFCDMRDFTRVSELLPPEALRSLVNSFFSSMTAAIRGNRGTLDKYIGDAIMAFWGAPIDDPQHAGNAVRAALEMKQRLETLNTELGARGLPRVALGLGLNTGLVCVGDMGSTMRRSYTVMGDAVNLASRIEGLTRHYGVDILAGAETRDADIAFQQPSSLAPRGASKQFQWVEVDRVRVKGKTQSVTLFTPVTAPGSGLKTFDEEMRLWRLALTAYRLQHWDEAQVALRHLQRAYIESPLGGIYQQLDARIDNFRGTSPTPEWDGAHTFESK